MWTPSLRYPEPAIDVLDPRFLKYRVMNASIERLATGFRWCEGPVWMGDTRQLIWSDIPNDRLMRWDDASGAVSVLRQPSQQANGNTRDRQGRLITCEHLGRRVTRTEYDGSLTVIADRYQGKRLNSPNDVVVKSDDSIWFTDPPFGLLGWYEGVPVPQELPTHVYRVDGATGDIALVCADINRPNGLCFSPDEQRMYIVESGTTPRRIHVFDLSDDGRQLRNGRLFMTADTEGTPDGFRCDVDGNLWAGWGMGEGHDGVRVFAPDATPLAHIHLPERCANVCFGGARRNRLFMAASHSLYALYVNTQGATAC
ncbi:MAG: SMP-30/gluconolactonase/LRE family protein [Limnohabitans sp.]|nr:SMP-30/gluconolactonase/LRE family protein [Betaproteobacteria bacterium]